MKSLIPGRTILKMRRNYAFQYHTRENAIRFVISLYYSLMLHRSLVLNYDTVMTLHIGKQFDLITDNWRMLVITRLVLKVEMWKGKNLTTKLFSACFLSEEMKNNVRRHSLLSWKPRDTLSAVTLWHSLRSDTGCVVLLCNATLCQSEFMDDLELHKLQQYVIGRASNASILITVTTLYSRLT